MNFICFKANLLDMTLVLLTAHLIADFVLQPDWMIKLKNHKARRGELLHALIHASLVWVLFWNLAALPFVVLMVFASHFFIDRLKLKMINKYGDNLRIFLVDQLGHFVAVMFTVCIYALAGRLLCFNIDYTCGDFLRIISIVISLLIIATGFFGHIIGFVTKNIVEKNELNIDGLNGGGKLIGNLERALIFFLVLFNMTSVIGLIATAKSILRFGEIKNDWKVAEYILIGTLLSFLIAIVAGFAAKFAIVKFYGCEFLKIN